MFGTYACGTGTIPPLAPPGTPPPDPIPLPIAPGLPGVGPLTPAVDQLNENLRNLINTYAYGNGNVAAPPCEEQPPLGNLVGQGGKYPHVLEAPEK